MIRRLIAFFSQKEHALPDTELTIKIQYHSRIKLPSGRFGHKDTSSESQVLKKREDIKLYINENYIFAQAFHHHSIDTSVKITLLGKLFGNDINKKFDDINLFTFYLYQQGVLGKPGDFSVESQLVTILNLSDDEVDNYMRQFDETQLGKINSFIINKCGEVEKMISDLNKLMLMRHGFKVAELPEIMVDHKSRYQEFLADKELVDKVNLVSSKNVIAMKYIDKCLPVIQKAMNNLANPKLFRKK